MNMCFQLAYADMESYSDLEMVIFSSLLSFVWEHMWLCTDVCSFAIWYTHSVNVDPSLSFVWEHMCLCTVVCFFGPVHILWLKTPLCINYWCCPQAFDADLRAYLKQVTGKEVIASQVHEVGGYIRVKGRFADLVCQFLLDKGF